MFQIIKSYQLLRSLLWRSRLFNQALLSRSEEKLKVVVIDASDETENLDGFAIAMAPVVLECLFPSVSWE